ncbi:hypothetical protein [Parasitella parasitica]|uniref:Synaptobrevin homolog YKT6 n=1 Tax=Parasitella parasitica TaxID=35722 RepID=A0A0B7N106_9FUNG|nr:hypothetical protein [Parasitella parasitica]
MKLYSILVLRIDDSKARVLASKFDLSSFAFFNRGSCKEFMEFSAITVAERTSAGQRQSVEIENIVGHVYRNQPGIAGAIISDKEYSEDVAFSLLHKILDEFLVKFPADVWRKADTLDYPELQGYLQKYQNPQEHDPIMKVQKELDETTEILHKTIESVLQRGEKLDSLVDRSEALSSQSKMFYKTAKKTNSCCVVM